VSPVLRITTTGELFRDFEERYGSTLPSYSGDLTPYWEDGAASTAFELGLVQKASERLIQAALLASMDAPDSYDQRAHSEAWDAVNLWVEHTWGAWNSVSDPDEPGAIAQWNIKQDFAHTADRRTADLMERALGERPIPGSDEIEVVNTASWARKDIVFVSARESAGGDCVEDDAGRLLLSQRLGSGELAFLAEDIPPFGSRRYRIKAGVPEAVGDARAQGLKLTNGIYSIDLDPANGTLSSLCTVADGREFVEQTNAGGLNEFIYVAGTSPSSARSDSVTAVRTHENGPLVASLVVESRSPGCNSIRREIRLYHGLDRVEIINTIDKQPVRDMESVYFRFSFDIPNPVTRLDLGWGVIRPELDQLPGSCKDYFSVQRSVDVSGSDRGVTWSTVEAPLVELGQITDETHHNDGPGGWKTTTGSSSVLLSFVMNNYWHTNYKADQEGQSTFHYAIRPHGGYDPLSAYRFGVERNQPLLVRSIGGNREKPHLPFQIESD
ncbi:MAG: hypothetical protein IH628_16870, partial [Proteobacteria bacterium]|nr:hypothetical protein [Pseudomonadota bacterium]